MQARKSERCMAPLHEKTSHWIVMVVGFAYDYQFFYNGNAVKFVIAH